MAEPKITKELLQKAMACETPEEFIELGSFPRPDAGRRTRRRKSPKSRRRWSFREVQTERMYVISS